MKKFILTLFLGSLFFFSNGQDIHKKFMIGGNANITIKNNHYLLYLSPNIGYSPIKNTVVGVRADIERSKGTPIDLFKYSNGLYLRYYISAYKLKPFIETNFYLGKHTIVLDGNDFVNDKFHGASGGAGISYFITESIALELLGSITYTQIKGEDTWKQGTKSRFGFQVFF